MIECTRRLEKNEKIKRMNEFSYQTNENQQRRKRKSDRRVCTFPFSVYNKMNYNIEMVSSLPSPSSS